jgi:hypothetical protein
MIYYVEMHRQTVEKLTWLKGTCYTENPIIRFMFVTFQYYCICWMLLIAPYLFFIENMLRFYTFWMITCIWCFQCVVFEYLIKRKKKVTMVSKYTLVQISLHRCQPLRFFRNCYEFRAKITVLRSTDYLLRISDYCCPGTVTHLNIIVIMYICVFIPTTVLNGQVLFAIFAIGIMFPCRFHKAREEYVKIT